MVKRLIDFNRGSLDDFTDYLLVVAQNIEDGLVTAGAEPGKDYTYLDLITLAQPFVLERMKGDRPLKLL